jgi:hypothetical protein
MLGRRFLVLGVGIIGGLLAFACNSSAEDDDPGSDEGQLINRNGPAMNKARLDSVIAQGSIKSLDKVPAALPKEFLINVTLKHGRLFEGERGHLVERVVSQSSDPKAPRAILWDERSGFSVSYNGGAPGQTAGNRLDVLDFDDAKKEFHLAGLEFSGNAPPVYKTDADLADGQKCSHCHGANHRPIFSMYPDWPSFYGSDNDELTDTSKVVQERESQEYKAFRAEVTTRQLPRYLPLFDKANIRAQLRGTELYPTFPYRPDTNTNIEATSRSFAFRPSLRFGILENRQMAEWTAKKIIDHDRFEKFGAFFLHDLLQCRWPNANSLQTTGWLDAVKEANGGAAPRTVANGKTLHYRDLLKVFGLTVNDIDIRYSHNHSGYENENATNKVMQVGYIDGSYWNSYFDGSATIDELVAMHLYKKLSTTTGFTDLAGIIDSPDGLVVKYSRRAQRFLFDKNFFEEMDKKGTWIPIPYPQERLNDLHHREGYPTRFSNQHRNLCAKLESKLQSVGGGTTPGGGGGEATSCPANCVASEFCRNHPNASQAIKVNGLPCMVSGAGGCQPCSQ